MTPIRWIYAITSFIEWNVHPQVVAIAFHTLKNLKSFLKKAPKEDLHISELLLKIDEFFGDSDEFVIVSAPEITDGSPIFMNGME